MGGKAVFAPGGGGHRAAPFLASYSFSVCPAQLRQEGTRPLHSIFPSRRRSDRAAFPAPATTTAAGSIHDARSRPIRSCFNLCFSRDVPTGFALPRGTRHRVKVGSFVIRRLFARLPDPAASHRSQAVTAALAFVKRIVRCVYFIGEVRKLIVLPYAFNASVLLSVRLHFP